MAIHQHPKIEDFWLWVYARKRVEQVNAAGYKAHAVDLRANAGRSGVVRVFIERGKHADLSRLPAAECPDIIVEGHGSISILRGMTDAGYAWIEEHVSDDRFQPFGLGARLVEPRFVADIIAGARRDGIEVR